MNNLASTLLNDLGSYRDIFTFLTSAYERHEFSMCDVTIILFAQYFGFPLTE